MGKASAEFTARIRSVKYLQRGSFQNSGDQFGNTDLPRDVMQTPPVWHLAMTCGGTSSPKTPTRVLLASSGPPLALTPVVVKVSGDPES
jgi:hypothetical protein